MSLEQAKAVADATCADDDGRTAIDHERTQDHDFGWVFYPYSVKERATGDRKYGIPGLGPFVVERENLRVVTFPSMRSFEDSLADYAKQWRSGHRTPKPESDEPTRPGF